MPRAAPRDMMAPIMEPDWLTRAMRPAGRVSASSAAFTVQATRSLRLTMPMELGPRMRRPARRARGDQPGLQRGALRPGFGEAIGQHAGGGMPLAATASITPSTCGVLSRI